VSAKGLEPSDFAWMPDGKSLLISDRPFGGSGDRLAVHDLSGKRLRVVPTRLRFQAGNGMAVRADGKVAVVAAREPSDFETQTDLVEVDLSTGESRNLTSTPDLFEGSPAYVDNDTVVFDNGKIVGLTQGPNGWIGVLDVGSGAVRQLTPDEQAAGNPAVVGDGSAVVYDAFRRRTATSRPCGGFPCPAASRRNSSRSTAAGRPRSPTRTPSSTPRPEPSVGRADWRSWN
jgi:hypothetical protein